MTGYLDELYAHQEWADAEHWRAFEAHPPALEDKAIRERLHHIHLVQHAFLWATGPRSDRFASRKLEEFQNISDLKKYAQEGLRRLSEFVQPLDPTQAEQIIEIPRVSSTSEDFHPPGSHPGRHAQPLSPRPERHPPARTRRRPAADRFHRVAAQRTTARAMGLAGFLWNSVPSVVSDSD
jgi:hypothetical protein